MVSLRLSAALAALDSAITRMVKSAAGIRARTEDRRRAIKLIGIQPFLEERFHRVVNVSDWAFLA